MKKSTTQATLFEVSKKSNIKNTSSAMLVAEQPAVETTLANTLPETKPEPVITTPSNTEDNIIKLNHIVPELHDSKKMEAMYKSRNTEMSNDIKLLLSEMEIKEFVSDCGITASVTVTQKESLDMEKLTEYLMPLDIPNLITMVPTVDLNVLEAEIYKGTIKAVDIAPFKTLDKPVVKLFTKEPKAPKKAKEE